MQKDTLTFHITLPNATLTVPRDPERMKLWGQQQEIEEKFSQEFIHSLGLKVHSGIWSNVDLDSPEFETFYQKAAELISSGKAKFCGFNFLSQILKEDADDQYEWFLLKPTGNIGHDFHNGIISCKACKMKPNIHTATGWSYVPFLSEKFKSIVEKHNLSGLDFLWLIDKGRYQAAQWYAPVAQKPLGRGIDHPWFDPATLGEKHMQQPKDPIFRTGNYRFYLDQIRENIHFDNEKHSNLLNLFHSFELTIISYRRYLRQYMPDTDFAFVWDDVDRRNSDGIFRARYLCMNQKAKEILVRERVIGRNEYEPILILDEVPEESVLLDGSARYPSPAFTEQEMVLLKECLDEKWQKYIATPKPIRRTTIEEALSLLRKSKKNQAEDYKKGFGKKKINAASIELPEYWTETLAISNEAMLNTDCTIISFEKIKSFHEEMQAYIKTIYDEYPHQFLAIGYGADGDWFVLDSSEDFKVDCKVHRISHEDLSIVESWDSIPIFIYDMLSDYDT